jgi:hypothetical protein
MKALESEVYIRQNKLNVISAVAVVGFMSLVVVAVEIGAPVLAGAAAIGSIATGIVRLVNTPKNERPH